MMSVGLSIKDIDQFLTAMTPTPTPLVVACNNSPGNVTVSGEETQIAALKVVLDDAGIFNRKLKVNIAYHSPQMSKISADYINSIQDIEQGDNTTQYSTMISTVTGQRISTEELLQPSYWGTNMVSKVCFVEAVEHICARNVRKKLDGSHLNNLQIDICIEVGPHPALSGPVRDITGSKDRSIPYFPTIRRQSPAQISLLETAGKLHCHGYPINIEEINRKETDPFQAKSLCDLPEYPFDHSKSYFAESRISKGLRLRSQPKLDLLGKTNADWNPMDAKWRNFLKLSEIPWVEHHKVGCAYLKGFCNAYHQ
jgi:acyl transferase domain-containing protein